MDENEFAKRVVQLREQKGVSARDMSLGIAQNANYLYFIENGKSLPSMSAFFFMCDYLGITPAEFFDTSKPAPGMANELAARLKMLNEHQLRAVEAVVDAFLQDNDAGGR